MAFVLKSILSDMSIVTPAFLSFPLAWNIFFHPLTFNLCVSFALKWVSCRQHNVGSCFFYPICHFVSFNWSPLTFKVITDTYVFIDILKFVFLLILYFFFFPFFSFVFPFVVWWFSFVLNLCSLIFGFYESMFLICVYPVFQVCNPFLLSTCLRQVII